MINKQLTGTSIESLIDMLASKKGMVRKKARESLVAMGRPAVPSLTKALMNASSDRVRWEAAKTLGAINDPRAIPSLVKVLEDSDHGVVWLAAEALSEFKKAAWPSLLRRLIKIEPDSVILRQGAHHVLRNQKEVGYNDLLATLMEALESNTGPEATKMAAYDILKRMKATL